MNSYAETAATTSDQKFYNYRQSRARMVVENSFGRLKGRWRCLLKRLDLKLENIPHIVASCIVLHNMCELYGDNCLDEWTDPSVDDHHTHHIAPAITSNPAPLTLAIDIRDGIMKHLSS